MRVGRQGQESGAINEKREEGTGNMEGEEQDDAHLMSISGSSRVGRPFGLSWTSGCEGK